MAIPMVLRIKKKRGNAFLLEMPYLYPVTDSHISRNKLGPPNEHETLRQCPTRLEPWGHKAPGGVPKIAKLRPDS